MSGTPKRHPSARRGRNVQCSVVPAGHLHPDTIEEGKAYYTKNKLMGTFSHEVFIYPMCTLFIRSMLCGKKPFILTN